METSIQLTKENMRNLTYENIMFVSIIEAFASKNRGSLYFLLENGKLYYANYLNQTDFNIEDIYKIFPPLKNLVCISGQVYKLDPEWGWIYLGAGNYLLVRRELYSIYIEQIELSSKNYQNEWLALAKINLHEGRFKKFDWSKWKYKKVDTKSEELKLFLDNTVILGKTITNICLLGKIDNLDKQSMVTTYNNNYLKPGEEKRIKILEDDIPLETNKLRSFTTEDPFVIFFDDGTTLEMASQKDFKISIGTDNTLKNINPLTNINFKRVFSPMLGCKILNYEINARNIQIYLEQNLRLIIGEKSVSLLDFNNPEKYPFKIKDFKKCIPFYSDLFTKREDIKDRNSLYRENKPISAATKDAIALMYSLCVPQSDLINIALLLKNENAAEKFIKYISNYQKENNNIPSLQDLEKTAKKLNKLYNFDE